MAGSPPIDHSKIPDFDKDFVNDDDIAAFEKAINAPDTVEEEFITALNDWRPVKQKVKRKKRKPRRGKDETREGIVYLILKWPLLVGIGVWVLTLSIIYLLTRFYIAQYEYWIAWRGKRQRLRKQLRAATSYPEWISSAKTLDSYLGLDLWKESDAFAYYDYGTIRRILRDMKDLRQSIEGDLQDHDSGTTEAHNPSNVPDGSAKGPLAKIEELRRLLEACIKSNFGGIESSRLYSQTYYGTKILLQEFYDEVENCLKLILDTDILSVEEKRVLFKHLHQNFGQTALCLSGGATFAYYHLGVVKALLDADLLPKVVTGTSGGALVAALLCTRTNTELKQILVPELAHKITACHDDTWTWMQRWWKTGARFDSVDWARRCCWFTRGSMTFKEAYRRTGRVLNISCIPSDPHSPSLLLNHITAPDCVIWSATIASAAVPGILNPVVLMMKTNSGGLIPFSFGNKWKDGSLRTDIPLRALNLHYNVNFSIVSQVNPHINIFFFSSRGTVGRPVTHRRGKGWRGGFLGSALEQYLKLDLAKWLKVLRHLELLPRPLSQDWSSLWLQKFDGNITIWPKSVLSDFYYILSDPTIDRLAGMIQVGQSETFPKLLFISNRLKIERLVQKGRKDTRGKGDPRSDGEAEKTRLEYDMWRRDRLPSGSRSPSIQEVYEEVYANGEQGYSSGRKSSSWFGSWSKRGWQHSPATSPNNVSGEATGGREGRRNSRLKELSRQGSVIFGFEDSGDSTDESGFEEVQGGEERYIESTGSELGESEGFSGADDGHEQTQFVEGGRRAVL
ncbi:patatin-domain-containing protein [Terfezia boudieri ATCC MYA-4762]|uniref:Patatin-like phospholipase domain-containing protein n=1 Tax=Terfezia boudieri ATCC MYA-4762 TaxID=1051890 RepID=A0A3N4LJ10_9PEZI|nr:patatin-domain-containing protein [Terfezia boudieri ATCC MYA-4762]